MSNVQQGCAPTHTTTLKMPLWSHFRCFIGNYVHLSATGYSLARQKNKEVSELAYIIHVIWEK